NLFDMYQTITGENAYKTPMRIYPAVHYTMGGLWVDYNLMSNVPGLFVLGEANFSDHGANRLGASALMQGLADGYFVIPYTIANYLATIKTSNTPGASLIFLSLANCFAATRCIATNRAAGIFAWSIRRPTARRCATTKTFPMWRPGNSRARAIGNCIRSRSFTTKCT